MNTPSIYKEHEASAKSINIVMKRFVLLHSYYYYCNNFDTIMPFDVFHLALEKTIGRPVFTHEFALNLDGLKEELFGEKNPPTLEEILNMIPEDKRIIILKK